MELERARRELERAALCLEEQVIAVVREHAVGDRVFRLAISARFVRLARKARQWKTPRMLTALKNASYGFDPRRSRSRGGADGVFLVDRDFRPANAMMRKLYDRFLDKPGSGASELATALGVERSALTGARLVSHHMRLLGVLHRGDAADTLVLVDLDTDKG